MNLFEELKQRVALLNSRLQRVQEHPASETRKILHTQLWSIVEELNERLQLRLENTALDLHVEGDHLVIHYFERVRDSADHEVFVRIDPSFSVERHAKNIGKASAIADLLGKQVAHGSSAEDRFTIPGWELRSSDLPPGIENARGWDDEASQGSQGTQHDGAAGKK
jgi:hypothetical protein